MNNCKHKHKNLLTIGKVILFLIILCLVYMCIQTPFKVQDNKMFQHVRGFYAEPANSLDMVYVGASNVYPWYEPPVAWNYNGIATFDLSVPGMPAPAIRYVVEEAHKTQPGALYVINLNNFKNRSVGYVRIHNVADHMKFSGTKVRMIEALTSYNQEFSGMEKAEFYFPIIRFHTGWSELQSTDFVREINGLKGGDDYPGYFTTSVNVSDLETSTKGRVKMKDYQRETLGEFMDYCKEEQIKVLFVAVPQMTGSKDSCAQINAMGEYAKSEGFDVFNMWDDAKYIDEIGFDITQDFQDMKHLNVHGAAKYTRYLAEYLQKNYHFADKRDDPSYSSWTTAVEKYNKEIAPYTVDFERDNSARDFNLNAPILKTCVEKGTKMKISWDTVDGAEGYMIYRKMLITHEEGTTDWEQLALVNDESNEFEDSGLREFKTYFYTVVPISYDDNNLKYGHFDYEGISRKSSIDPPKITAVKETDSGIIISWESVKSADGYVTYHKDKFGKWKREHFLDKETHSYVINDNNDAECYSIGSYIVKNDDKVCGYFNHDGLVVSEE